MKMSFLNHPSLFRSQVVYFRVSVIMMMLLTIIWASSRCEGVKVQLPPNVSIPAVFAFGDSIVDQGANNALKTLVKANFPPYGKDLNGGKPTGRFTNAETPADLIAQALGLKNLVPAYVDPRLQPKDLVTGVSFASGGSGYDPQTPTIVSVLSLSDQINQFKEYIGKLKAHVGEERANFILSNAVYLVVAGSDDLANTYFTVGLRKLQYDIPSYADLMVSSASSFIQEMYNMGARRMAVFGTPPIGCLPSQRTLAGGAIRMCSEKYNQAAKIVNAKLDPLTQSLTQKLPGSRIVYVDIYNPLFDIIQRPRDYGFDVVEKGCCGTGAIEVAVLCSKYSPTCPDDSKYLFWDSYHPTSSGYRTLIDQIIQGYIDKFV